MTTRNRPTSVATAARRTESVAVPEISLEQIVPDPDQPRSEFLEDHPDPAAKRELQSLADNIKALGVIQPIRVRPNPDGEGYLLIAGERRYRAARLAGLETVPAIVDLERDQADVRMLVQISENLQRSDLRLLDLATALDRLRRSSKLPDKQLAEILGRSKSWFSQHLRPLRSKGAARTALESNLVQSTEALRLFEKLPEPRQEKLLRGAEESGVPISRGQVKPLVERLQKAAEPTASTTATEAPKYYTPRLTADDLRRVIKALGRVPPAEDEELVRTLHEILTGVDASS